MAKRTTPKKKAKILQFIASYNAENKRGGQSAAAKKYGISVVTLIKWQKEAPVTPKAAKKATGRPSKKVVATVRKRKAMGGRKSNPAIKFLSKLLKEQAKLQTKIIALQVKANKEIISILRKLA